MTMAKEDLIELGRLSPERFWRAWRGNEIGGLPCRSCSVDQAYRAYKRWAMQEGERFPMSKPQFSRLVLREAGDGEFKAVQARLGSGQAASVARLWLMAAPPPGMALNDHAKDCVDSFELLLRDWSGHGAGAEA
jgi:phage/plasmid-associated DNA primase